MQVIHDWLKILQRNLGVVVALPISVVVGLIVRIDCIHPYEEYIDEVRILVGVYIFVWAILIFVIAQSIWRHGRHERIVFPVLLLSFLVITSIYQGLNYYKYNYCLIESPPRDQEISDTEDNQISPTSPEHEEFRSIAIVEVMCNPESSTADPREAYLNEYLEIYNYGDQDVDVNGLWISTTREKIGGDQIIPWADRSAFRISSNNLVYNTTVIPPYGIALILPPNYYLNSEYGTEIPSGTIILTIAEPNEYLGQEGEGIVCSRDIDTQTLVSYADIVILYKGDSKIIEEIISSYGGEDLSAADAISISDSSPGDDFPKVLSRAGGVVRVCPRSDDEINNWFFFGWVNRSPGTLFVSEECL